MGAKTQITDNAPSRRIWLVLVLCLVLIIPTLAAAQSTTVVDAPFNSGTDGFVFVPDVFSTPNQTGYASGSYQSNGGYSGGGLLATVGGIDGDDITDMSAGWQIGFNLAESGNTTVTFRYNLTQTLPYESDEYSDLRLSIDGSQLGQGGYLVRIVGDGNSGSDISTGWQQMQVDLGPLGTGNHDLAIGVYNNKKTYPDESTSLLIDDVKVEQGDPPPLSGILVGTFDGGDPGSFAYIDDAFRQTNQPEYADGIILADGAYNGGGLQVNLAGIHDNAVYGMAGGWRSGFYLQEATDLTVSFRYNLSQSPEYEGSEYSQVMVTVDGLPYGAGGESYVAQIAGDGNGGSAISTGWQTFYANIGAIPSGDHTITIGGYNSGKTSATEFTTIVIDDVVVDGTPSSGSQVISSGVDVVGYHGAVASGITATDVGIDILAQGGNAYDAAAASILALTEADYSMVHFGGEVPIIYYDKASDQIQVISGQGPAPAAATLSYFSGGIPSSSNLKNAAVPGTVLAVLTLLNNHGTMTFEQVAQPTQQLFAAHTGWKTEMAATLQRMIDVDKNTRNGNGTRQDGLVAVREFFYNGQLADEMQQQIISQGGIIRKSDLAAYGSGKWSPYEDPLSTDYRGYDIFKVGPWTQGPYLLETLNIMEGYNVQAMGHNQPDYIHHTVEALKLGLADRDTYFGDPNFVYVPTTSMITKEYANLRRGLIDPTTASRDIRPGNPDAMQPLSFDGMMLRSDWEYGPVTPTHDTSTVVTADRWGNVVVATPSGWGGVRLDDSAIYYGNRLRSLNTWAGHPNVVEPFKRPRITLTPTLIMKDDVPVVGLSVAGSDKQDQSALQIITNYIDFGFAAGDAVSTPRFGTSHHTGSFSQPPPSIASLSVHNSTSSSIQNDLDARGHNVSTYSSSYAWPNMVIIHPESGTFESAGDAAASRRAAAFTDLTAVPDNAAPIADAQSISTAEETPIEVTLTGSDADNDPITFTIVDEPGNGSTLTPVDADTYTYSPAVNFFGADSFTFVANDGKSNSAPAMVTIDVDNVNDAPVAFGDSVTTDEDTPVTIVLQASDVDGDVLDFVIVDKTTSGSLTPVSENTYTYTPDANFNGSDTLTFKVIDTSAEESPIVTVNITVNAVNDAPTADDKSESLDEDGSVLVGLSGTDVDGTIVDYTVTSQPANGSLTGSGSSHTYTPNANFSGSDSFKYAVTDDGGLSSAEAVVSLTIDAVNDAPVADDQDAVTFEDQSVDITLTGSDIDSGSLSFAIVDAPSNGSLSAVSGSLVTYTPTSGFDGSDSFTFVAYDGQLNSAPGTVSITVHPTNDPPLANAQIVNTDEDMPISITLTGSDNEGAPLSFEIVDLPDHGLLDDSSLPNVLYTPDINSFGDDSFSFKVNDGVQDSDVAVVDITVAAVNDPPVASNQSISTNADTPVDITLTAQDIDGGPLSFAIVTGPANGTLDDSNAPNVTYTPNPGFDGSDSFTFKANDTIDDSEAATVDITVNPSGPSVVFFDDFEGNQGWVTNAGVTDTATTGMWERANPEPVDSSGPKQLGYTVSGSNALVTGPLAGSSAGSHDIDKGVTSVRSPAFKLPTGKDLTLSFHYYLSHRTNSSTADFLRVSVVTGSTTVVFEELGAGNDDDAVWAQTSVNLNAFAGQTVRLLIEAADASNGSLVEAAIDDVSIVAAPPATSILQVGFDSGEEGFSYVDNAFSSGNAAYASGSWLAGGGFSGGGLQVYVGGQDNADIFNMSGGWREQFNLAAAASTVLTFRYNLTIDAEYESNEYSEVRVTVGSNEYTVSRITGDGNGGSDDSSGWQLAQIDLGSLPAGSHTITIGVFNNQKTYNNEWSTVNIDDVEVAVR